MATLSPEVEPQHGFESHGEEAAADAAVAQAQSLTPRWGQLGSNMESDTKADTGDHAQTSRGSADQKSWRSADEQDEEMRYSKEGAASAARLASGKTPVGSIAHDAKPPSGISLDGGDADMAARTAQRSRLSSRSSMSSMSVEHRVDLRPGSRGSLGSPDAGGGRRSRTTEQSVGDGMTGVDGAAAAAVAALAAEESDEVAMAAAAALGHVAAGLMKDGTAVAAGQPRRESMSTRMSSASFARLASLGLSPAPAACASPSHVYVLWVPVARISQDYLSQIICVTNRKESWQIVCVGFCTLPMCTGVCHAVTAWACCLWHAGTVHRGTPNKWGDWHYLPV